MPERWVRACRWFVPEPWRRTAFDPALADLQRDWVTGPHSRRRARAAGGVLLAIAIGFTALECRRLAAREALARLAHSPTPESRLAMLWSVVSRACKVFVRQPVLAAVVVLTLAVGIGANLTVFSLVNQFLLAPVPAPHPGELVRVAPITSTRESDVISFPNYRDLRDGMTSVELAAHAQPRARVGPMDAGELRTVELVTGNYFRMLGVAPLRGRLITERDDDVEGAHPVLVLGASYWRSHYASSDAAIGQTLLVNSTPFEIVGVAPEGYHGTYNARQVDLWAPMTMQAQVRPRGRTLDQRGWGWLSMIGRLRPGVSVTAAQGDADRVVTDITRRFPQSGGGLQQVVVAPASPMAASDQRVFRPALGATFAFTVLLLVVTCANLAGVMQARLVGRRRELAIRRSLGAGRARLMGEWLAESIALSVAGGTAGFFGSQIVGLWLSSVKLPVELVGDLTLDTQLDWRLAVYATGISIVTGLLFGVIPAMRAGFIAPMAVLKEEGSGVLSARSGNRMRRILVIVQVSVSVVLLLGSGLLAASLSNQRLFDPGFETVHIALFEFDLRRQGVPQSDWQPLTERLLDRVRQHPGVVRADVAMTVPLAPGHDRLGFSIPGYTSPAGTSRVSIDYNVVGPDYFNTLGGTFVHGSSWTRGAGAHAIVVNETMARRFWPGVDPVGKAVNVIDGPELTVTGVVRDTTYYDIGEAPISFAFLPAEGNAPSNFLIVTRTAGDPGDVLRDIARAAADIDRRLAPSMQVTFDQARAVPLFPLRILAGAATAFGIIAMLLTAVGLYGVVSTMVGQRTREIGVRMALGARSVTVLGSVLRDALVVAALGALFGLVAGYWGAGQLGSWLYGVGRFDTGIYLAVVAITIALALVSAAVPARRASKVDPVVALRT